MSRKKRRPQTSKRQDSKTQYVLELRRGSRAQPIPSKKAYNRRNQLKDINE